MQRNQLDTLRSKLGYYPRNGYISYNHLSTVEDPEGEVAGGLIISAIWVDYPKDNNFQVACVLKLVVKSSDENVSGNHRNAKCALESWTGHL